MRQEAHGNLLHITLFTGGETSFHLSLSSTICFLLGFQPKAVLAICSIQNDLYLPYGIILCSEMVKLYYSM
jgi:hypothetical protein